ncbi:MAG TPA: filamentous hemagglutinin N-terminal domain-containing protein, partial [Ideonella sp.]|nr:filamentous hemagglutinin N-terminal domain-containing protein [Ideonella sp.]
MNTALHPARRAPRPQPLALALAACSLLTLALAAPQARAQALPGGLNVVHGQAQVNTAGKTMTVTNSNGAILNWQSFNIAAGQTVRFQQPGASSQVLNRVVGKDASSIFGNLSSNGKVWLLNPNGVLFGRSARIDVAGLVVSTLNLADNDFLANRYSLATALADMPGADIVNQGELRTTLGGRVALLGGNVRNEGLIDAPGGQVLLAAGRSIDLVDTGVPNLTVRVSAPAGEALNMGSLAAAGGRVDLQAAIVNQQGLVRADALALGAGGEVVLRGSQAVNLAAGSVTSAAGNSAGGRVTADAGGGTTLVAGTVDVSAAHGVGGDVRLLGRQVGLVQAGRIEASGATGGGEVLVGGGQQGRDASVPNAEATYFSPDASIHADATERGNGGRVILWSNQATRAYGELSAMGGASGGDGGFIETSGGWLDAAPRAVNTRSRAGGQHGEWLLDPNNILIQDSIAGGNYTGDPLFTSTGDDAQIDSQVIIDALNAGNNVTVTTTSSGANTQAGDITVSNANIFPFANVPTSLSLLADRDIIVENSNIGSSSGQPLSVSLTAARNGGVGRIAISGSSIDTSGGNLTLGGNATAGANAPAGFLGAVGYDSTPSATYSAGVTVQNSSLDVGEEGTLRITGGNIAQATTGADGVAISASSLFGFDVLIDGFTDAPAGQAAAGVAFYAGADVQADNALVINGSSANGIGVNVLPGSILHVHPSSEAVASLSITGSSLFGSGPGVLVQGGGSPSTQLIVSGGAALTVSGSSAGGPGVRLVGNGATESLIDAELGASLTLQSTGGSLEIEGSRIAAPDDGTLTATSTGDLSLLDSTVFGVPASAAFSAVGDLTLTDSQLAFNDSATAVSLSAQTPTTGLGTLTITDSVVNTLGKIDVRTDSLSLIGDTTLSANAAGDAIVIAGTSANPNVQALDNQVGDGVLQVDSASRWLVYLTDPASASLQNTNLDYAFKQYAAAFDDAVFSGGNIITAGTGKGLMYAITPTVTIT